MKKPKERLQKEKPTKQNELEKKELEDLCKRVQADFENFKKRSQKEKEEFSKFANTDLILQIIPVIDNFKLATHHLPEELRDNNWVQGILQIEKQLEQILASEGVEPIESVGHKFDPYIHEAIEEIDSEGSPGEVVEEITRGYRLNDRVIRHAKVKVSK